MINTIPCASYTEPTAQMLEVLYIFQQQMMMGTMLDSGNLLPDLQIMLYCQIFVKVKKLLKICSKVDKNCASDWACIFKTPVLTFPAFLLGSGSF